MANSSSSTSQNGNPSISWPVNRPQERQPWTPERVHDFRMNTILDPTQPPTFDTDLLPGRSRSLSSIAIHAFALGITFSLGALLCIYQAYHEERTWRPFFFVSTLSLFHFLEFWTTARYNTPETRADSFILTNGGPYVYANIAALVETTVTTLLFPRWQEMFTSQYTIAVGLALVILGQTMRSTAMATAGTNFNHLVQKQRKKGHQLVTNGVYAWSRHPSYAGFFWFALGTQLMIGNTVCFVLFAAILWRFFNVRIRVEEKYLMSFFGHDYQAYRGRTRVGIPFI